ncbi:hypothetical protein ES708_20825 [subsurface metagenome]
MKKIRKKAEVKKLLLDSGKIRPERANMLVNELFKSYKPKVPAETIVEAIIRLNTTGFLKTTRRRKS